MDVDEPGCFCLCIRVASRFILKIRVCDMQETNEEQFMQEQGVLHHPISENANKDEMKYMDGEIVNFKGQRESIEDKAERFEDNRLNILPHLSKKITIEGTILELAAGCCWLSSELSKFENVKKIYALDASKRALEVAAPKTMKLLDAKIEKITRVHGDFYKLNFEDETFDFVFFDAALHHIETSKFGIVMAEVKRVLKKDGHLVGIREPFLPDVPWIREHKRAQFGAFERQRGITENTYTFKEWQRLFKDSDLKCGFIRSVSLAKHDNGALKTVKNLAKAIAPTLLGVNHYIIVEK
jgi:ubiquinone/menaquinone biosynthesis C-methylase UbiE